MCSLACSRARSLALYADAPVLLHADAWPRARARELGRVGLGGSGGAEEAGELGPPSSQPASRGAEAMLRRARGGELGAPAQPSPSRGGRAACDSLALARGRALARRVSAPRREPGGGAAACFGGPRVPALPSRNPAAVTPVLGFGVLGGLAAGREDLDGVSGSHLWSRPGADSSRSGAAPSPGGFHAPAWPAAFALALTACEGRHGKKPSGRGTD